MPRVRASARTLGVLLFVRDVTCRAASAVSQHNFLLGITRQIEQLIHQQPAPENDRMTQRYRNEAQVLQTLIEHDEQLVGQCELMRSMVSGQDGAALLKSAADIESGLQVIRTTLQHREAVLLGPA